MRKLSYFKVGYPTMMALFKFFGLLIFSHCGNRNLQLCKLCRTRQTLNGACFFSIGISVLVRHTFSGFSVCFTIVTVRLWYSLASFPGPVYSSFAVQNLRRRSGLVHHELCAARRVITSPDNTAVLPSRCAMEL